MDYPNNNDGYGNSPGRRIDFGFPNNEGFRPPPNPPFASTPATNRAQRPRFAYSGPPNYPRPGSSAAKPNPSSFSNLMRSRYVPVEHSDSMMNNYGDSPVNPDLSYQPDRSFMSEYSSHNESMDSSVYFSCNESFSESPKKFPLLGLTPQATAGPSGGFQPNQFSGQRKQFKATSAGSKFKQKPKPYTKSKPQVAGKKSDWRCDLCDIDFTSRIPFAMHFQGQKHAKKLKVKEALKSIQSQVKGKEIVTVGSLFRCDICGTTANSSFQLQTHLDGLKHKAKVAQLAKEEEEKKNPKEKTNVEANPGEKSDQAQQNGSKKKGLTEVTASISVLPTNVGSVEMQALPKPPLADAAKPSYACDICDVKLNSELQYQQHILGKFHKAKVEGKPVPWKKNKSDKALVKKYNKKLKKDTEKETVESTTERMETTEAPEVEMPNEPFDACTTQTQPIEQVETAQIAKPVEQAANKTKPLVGILKNKSAVSQKVMGVTSLETSFVKSHTLE